MTFLSGTTFYARFASIGLFLLSSCGTESSQEKSAGGQPAEVVSATTTKLGQINMFVDASTGMRGFMHPNSSGQTGSQFQRTIIEVLSNIKGQQAASKVVPAYFFVQESTPKDPRVLRPTTYDELSNTVSTGIKNPALGTEMPVMLREILKLQKNKPGMVSIVVSDFIYAPPNPTQTWKVKTDVKDALSEAAAEKLAIQIFAGTSEFRDKFFPGNRTRFQVLNGAQLPYYVWVLGEPAAVADVAQLLRPLLGSDFKQVRFNTLAPRAAVFEHFGNMGTWYVDKNGKQQTQPLTLHFSQKPSRQEPADVVMGIDLGKTPAAEDAVLPRHLKLEDAGAGATLQKVWAVRDEPKAPVNSALPTYTHLVKIHIDRLPGSQPVTMRLVLPRIQPAWVAHYTTSDDTDIAKQGPKTFLLSEIIQGVQDYYEQQPAGREVWAVPIKLSPQ